MDKSDDKKKTIQIFLKKKDSHVIYMLRNFTMLDMMKTPLLACNLKILWIKI
tara:strand:- start:8902 stop:9057 length:156 start_codon:yes stop_codon:yes gene_type:complete